MKARYNGGDTGQSTAPAFVVPSHGRGFLLPRWQKGQSGNPSGVSGHYREVQKLAAEASPDAMRTLIAIASDPGEDTRCRIVAAQTVLDRGIGKVREAEPEKADRPKLDVSRLSNEDRAALKAILVKLGAGADQPRT